MSDYSEYAPPWIETALETTLIDFDSHFKYFLSEKFQNLYFFDEIVFNNGKKYLLSTSGSFLKGIYAEIEILSVVQTATNARVIIRASQLWISDKILLPFIPAFADFLINVFGADKEDTKHQANAIYAKLIQTGKGKRLHSHHKKIEYLYSLRRDLFVTQINNKDISGHSVSDPKTSAGAMSQTAGLSHENGINHRAGYEFGGRVQAPAETVSNRIFDLLRAYQSQEKFKYIEMLRPNGIPYFVQLMPPYRENDDDKVKISMDWVYTVNTDETNSPIFEYTIIGNKVSKVWLCPIAEALTATITPIKPSECSITIATSIQATEPILNKLKEKLDALYREPTEPQPVKPDDDTLPTCPNVDTDGWEKVFDWYYEYGQPQKMTLKELSVIISKSYGHTRTKKGEYDAEKN